MKIVTAWINDNDERTQRAQRFMIRSVLDAWLEPIIVNGTPRPLLTDMLALARSLTPDNGMFFWINSDCSFIPQVKYRWLGVCGHQRLEDDGTICGGVDAYQFSARVWDELYAPDLPSMYVGATHVDWWLTRLAQKHGVYSSCVGLRHPSHPRTDASKGLDEYGKHNLREYTAWALRNGISTECE